MNRPNTTFLKLSDGLANILSGVSLVSPTPNTDIRIENIDCPRYYSLLWRMGSWVVATVLCDDYLPFEWAKVAAPIRLFQVPDLWCIHSLIRYRYGIWFALVSGTIRVGYETLCNMILSIWLSSVMWVLASCKTCCESCYD